MKSKRDKQGLFLLAVDDGDDDNVVEHEFVDMCNIIINRWDKSAIQIACYCSLIWLSNAYLISYRRNQNSLTSLHVEYFLTLFVNKLYIWKTNFWCGNNASLLQKLQHLSSGNDTWIIQQKNVLLASLRVDAWVTVIDVSPADVITNNKLTSKACFG